jgi:hypothetical protein
MYFLAIYGCDCFFFCNFSNLNIRVYENLLEVRRHLAVYSIGYTGLTLCYCEHQIRVCGSAQECRSESGTPAYLTIFLRWQYNLACEAL